MYRRCSTFIESDTRKAKKNIQFASAVVVYNVNNIKQSKRYRKSGDDSSRVLVFHWE
jgi:hypothetical protein